MALKARLLVSDEDYSEQEHLTARQAAVLIDDALHGRNPNHKMDDHALWINEVLRSRWYTVTFGCVIVIDMLLAIFERPTSLRAIPAAIWSFEYTGIVELFCLLVFSADVALRYQYLTREQFWKSRWTLAKMAFVSLAIVNTVLYLGLGDGFPRIHRFVRPLMVAAHFRNVSKIFGNMIVSIPRVANVAVLLVFHVVFFGVLAHVMFGGISCTVDELDHWTCDCAVESETGEFCSPFSKNCFDYFGNIGCAMDQLFILLTTANFPDVMLPAYHCFSWAPVFFVSYLVIGLFFMLNLVLAVSYSVFQGHTKDKVLNTVNHRVITLDRVYDGVRTSQHFATDAAVDASEAEGGLTAKQQRKRRKLAKLAKAQSGRHAAASFDLHATGDGDSDSDIDDGKATEGGAALVGGRIDTGSNDAPKTTYVSGVAGAANRAGRAGSQTAGAELARIRRGDSSDGEAVDTRDTQGSGDIRKPAEFGEDMAAADKKRDAPALDGLPGEMGWPMWRRLMRLLRPDLNEAQIAVLFRTVDNRAVGSISKDDFREISKFIEVQFYAKLSGKRSEYFCYQCVPLWVTEWRQSVRVVVQHWVFRTFFDLLIYINAFLIVIDFSLTPKSSADTLVNLLLLILLGAFAVEVTIKLFGLGARAFVQDWFNVLDAVIVPAAIIADIVLAATGVQSRVVEKIAFLRILRLLRALRALPNFGLLIRTFSSIVPMFARYMLVAVLVYYMFAILGMELFAGLIEPPGPGLRPPSSLNDTAFLLNSYWDVTFNSLGRSYVTLFALMVVNNWAITMEGYAAVTNRWFMIYFYLWYFVIVILVLNIVTAFLLDDFTVMQAQIEDEENGMMPSWQKRLLQAARELRVRDRKNWTISRPKHPQQVYELMFADDIAEHLNSLDTIDNGLGQGPDEHTGYGSGGDGVRHRAAAAAAALLETDSRIDGAGGVDGKAAGLPFDPSAVLTHAGDAESRTRIGLAQAADTAVARAASLQQVDGTDGDTRHGQSMRALQLIAMDGTEEDWSEPSPMASAAGDVVEEGELLRSASSSRHTVGNHVEALQRSKRAGLHHTAADRKAVPDTGYDEL